MKIAFNYVENMERSSSESNDNDRKENPPAMEMERTTKGDYNETDRVSPTCVVTTWEEDDGVDGSRLIPTFTDETSGSEKAATNDVYLENESLRAQLKSLLDAAKEADSRKERMQENLRSKRVQIQTLERDLQKANKACKESRDAVIRLETKKQSMQQGIVRLEAQRDDFKGRWKAQVQTNKELHEQLAVEKAFGRREKARREKEQQLLDLYRKLSHLTGYLQMGKEIRMVEAALAEMQEK